MITLSAFLLMAAQAGPTLDTASWPLEHGEADSPVLIRQAGSIAKYVCTLTALRLENEGLLDLDASVADVLPDYAGPQDEALTVRRLLENRAGLEDQVVAALMRDADLPNQSIPALDAANRFGATAGAQAPGAAFEYVNSNWIVVQAVLEHAGGAPLADLVQHWVLQPAGADRSAFFVGDLTGPDRATAEGRYLPLPDFISCAGGLESTPADLLALVAYPFESDDFDAEDRADLTTITSPTQAYTIGGRFETVIDVQGAHRQISWQNGNNGPWFAQAVYDPATGQGWAAMSSQGGDAVLEQRAAWLAAQGLERAPRPEE